MTILSFDVGIKNLAYCLIDPTIPKSPILDWGVADLSNEKRDCCHNGCRLKATYFKNYAYYCSRHAKTFIKENGKYQLPPSKLKISKDIVNELKIGNLRKMCKVFDITTTKKSESELKEALTTLIDEQYMECVTTRSAKDIDLIEIGRSLHRCLNDLSSKWDVKPSIVLIENQISPIANRMKTIQGMISQYFISSSMYCDSSPSIIFLSSSNKLKDFLTEEQKQTSYDQRKTLGIETMRRLLTEEPEITPSGYDWLALFDKHTKKDDLADAYLQARWYVKHHM